MQEIEHTLNFVKSFFKVHHSSARIKVLAAVQDILDNNEEPAGSIKSVGKVNLLGYQYTRANETEPRQIMIAIGKNRHGTLHVRVATEKIRDMYPSPGELGKGEILDVLSEQVLAEAVE